jgi:uncharacterized protein (DUF885 family)
MKLFPKLVLAVITLVLLLLLAGCGDRSADSNGDAERIQQADSAQAEAGDTQEVAEAASDPLTPLLDAYMQHMGSRDPYLAMLSGKPVKKLPDQSLSALQEDAEFAAGLLKELESVDTGRLDHQQQLTAAMLERQLSIMVEELEFYWQGFSLTPYQSGFIFSSLLPTALKSAPLNSGEDVDSYLALVADVGRFVSEQANKLEGQAEQGIRLPKPALPGVRAVFAGLESSLPQLVAVDESRTLQLEAEDRDRLQAGIENALSELDTPAIERLMSYIGDDYQGRAPEAVGLSQYPGGKEYYRFLIRRETTLDLEPEEIHQRGLDYMAGIQQQMQAIRDELGFKGSQQEFHEQMRKDPRFFAKTPAEVEERMREYIERIEPKLPEYFSLMPKAPYDVKRLDAASEAGMTFGYYQAPNAMSETGFYRYNGSSLESRPQVWTGPLIYHELVPGHHFHLALQRENESLPEFRKNGTFITAFNEGWGNYGASLALEMGLLPDPYERYGWLLFDSFITARLVLDTGMNWFAWPLEQARQYMLDNTFASEAEAATETLRYSTDMPAQALGYKLGLEEIRKIRREAEAQYGDDFDIRAFHAAVVGSGALPMPLLQEHVRWYLKEHLSHNN